MHSARPTHRPLREICRRIAACSLLPLTLAGCEAEAVELVREISAARGECDREKLRASDEACVEMIGRYAEMGTDLVHTYIGGMKALDEALDRMPPPRFDTTGLGYAISPELRQGDPYGTGASPRLAPSSSPALLRAPAESGLHSGRGSETVRPAAQLSTRGAAAAWDRDRYASQSGYASRAPLSGNRSRVRPGLAARERALYLERREYEPFGYRLNRWGAYGFDPYRSGFLESGPYGYYSPGWSGHGYGTGSPFRWESDYAYGPGARAQYGYGFGYGRPYSDAYFESYRYPPSTGYGAGPSYGYAAPYGGDVDRRDAYGGNWRAAPDAEPGYYDPYEPYAGEYRYDGRYAPAGGGAGGETLSPAEDWGLEPGDPTPVEVPQGSEGMREPPTRQGPPRQRPGILLPPEERLRRPWIDD